MKIKKKKKIGKVGLGLQKIFVPPRHEGCGLVWHYPLPPPNIILISPMA